MNDQFNPRPRSGLSRARHSAALNFTMDEPQVDWTALFGLIRRRPLQITGITALLTAVALPFIMAMPTDFVARTRLILAQPSYVGQDADPSLEINVDTELERITSRANVQAVIDQLDLDSMPELNPDTPDLKARATSALRSWVGSTPVAAAPASNASQRILNAFYGRLSVRRDGASGIVELSFRAGNPQRAADVANLMVQSYVAQRNELRRDRLKAASDWLTPRIAQQKAIYEAELARARSFQEAKRLIATPGGSAASQAVAALSLRNDRLEQQHATYTSTLAMISQTAQRPLTPLPDEPAALTALRTELQTQQQELEDRQAQFGANYGGADLAAERIALTRDQIVRSAEAYGTWVQGAMQTTEADMEAVQAQLEQAQGGLSRQNVAEMQLADMLRTVDAEAEAMAALLRQQRGLQTGADIPAVATEILSPATPPLSAEGRGRKIYLALALIVAAVTAVLIAGLRELLDRRVRSTDQLSLSAETTPVGMLPALSRKDQRSLSRLIATSPHHPYANALRSMIVMVEAASPGGIPPSLLVCPAGHGQDSTTTASGLAFGLNKLGRRVLIVDCHVTDARAPIRESKPTALLPDDGQALRRVRLSDGGTGLADRIRAILDYGTITDSIVIFDADSVLASSETLQLATVTARTLLVSQWGVTHRRLVQLSAERLIVAADARILMALDGVNLRHHARSGFRDVPVAAQLSQARRGWI